MSGGILKAEGRMDPDLASEYQREGCGGVADSDDAELEAIRKGCLRIVCLQGSRFGLCPTLNHAAQRP